MTRLSKTPIGAMSIIQLANYNVHLNIVVAWRWSCSTRFTNE